MSEILKMFVWNPIKVRKYGQKLKKLWKCLSGIPLKWENMARNFRNSENICPESLYSGKIWPEISETQKIFVSFLLEIYIYRQYVNSLSKIWQEF